MIFVKPNVIMAIKPKYANSILNGTKQYEYRRRAWKDYDFRPVETLFIYATAPVKAVIGECEITNIEYLQIQALFEQTGYFGDISSSDFKKYFAGVDNGFAIGLSNPIRYEKPIPLTAFNLSKPPQAFCFVAYPKDYDFPSLT